MIISSPRSMNGSIMPGLKIVELVSALKYSFERGHSTALGECGKYGDWIDPIWS
jgi:hypothetical protein